MQLSMWILADWLKKYDMEISIEEGSCTLRSPRLLMETLPHPSSPTLFICHTETFIPSLSKGILCLNGRDYLLIKNDNMEEIYNHVQDAFDFYNEWEASLLNALEQKKDIRTLLQLSEKIFDNPVIISDAGGHGIANTLYLPAFETARRYYEQYTTDDFMDLRIQTKVNETLYGRYSAKQPYFNTIEEFPYRACNRNLHVGHELVGFITAWESNHLITQGQMQLMHILGDFLEKQFRLQDRQKDLNSRTAIMQEILSSDDLDKDTIRSYMNAIGWKTADPKILFLILPCSEKVNRREYLLTILQRYFPEAYIFEYESKILLVCNLNQFSYSLFQKQLVSRMKILKLYAGSSFVFHDMSLLRDYYAQAEIALKFGRKQPGQLNCCQDYIEPYISESLKQTVSVNIVHPGLQILYTHDQQHQTNYYRTLSIYLQEERSQTRTAARLNIHRNTLLRRLERITDLTGLDLNNHSVRLHLCISFLLFSPK